MPMKVSQGSKHPVRPSARPLLQVGDRCKARLVVDSGSYQGRRLRLPSAFECMA
jgi:hypothetical protein